jgi:hypothetical protein
VVFDAALLLEGVGNGVRVVLDGWHVLGVFELTPQPPSLRNRGGLLMKK